MKTKVSPNCLFIAFTLIFSSAAKQPEPDNLMLKKIFEMKMNQWSKAYNSDDAQNLVPLYSEDAIYTSSHVTGLEAIGREKLITNFQNGINDGGHIDKIEILKMDVSGEMAYLFCKYVATNSGITVSGRNLLVLKKIENQWIIVIHMTVV